MKMLYIYKKKLYNNAKYVIPLMKKIKLETPRVTDKTVVFFLQLYFTFCTPLGNKEMSNINSPKYHLCPISSIYRKYIYINTSKNISLYESFKTLIKK